MSEVDTFVDRLYSCPLGEEGWTSFEDVCIEILTYLFVPPLNIPRIQARTLSGTSRRDAAFPVRKTNVEQNKSWNQLIIDYNCRILLFEFKNYNKTKLSKKDVIQIFSYMREPMGRLSILISNKKVSRRSHIYIQRNTIYNEHKKLILILDKENLKEMLFRKERGEDPADVLLDETESFMLENE